MNISGTGISDFELKIQKNFRTRTSIALIWQQASNGNWNATDRGSSEDYYESMLTIRRKESDVTTYLEELYANRLAESNVITLSDFADNELIFGADVDHSISIDASIIEISMRKQANYNVFTFTMILRAISPSFLGSASFPSLRYLDYDYESDIETWTINTLDSYNNVLYYQDRNYDSGKFKGRFQFTTEELKGLRRWYATNRGATYTLNTINGVKYPFGPNSSSSYPVNVKLLSIENELMRDVDNWYCDLTLAEVV